MKTKKKMLWLVLAAATAIWVVFLWAFWDVLIMYIAPQAVLGDALLNTCTELEEYYEETPLPILLRGYNPEGQQTLHLELRSAAGGEAKGDVQVQLDLKTNQILLDGKLPNEPGLGNISLYLSRDGAALTSGALLGGGYYGITFDTFSQDLRSIPLVSFLVSETLISKWEEEVGILQKKMDFRVNLPQIPKIDLAPLRAAPAALWILPGRVSSETIIDVDGQSLPCYKVAYKLEGEAARKLWKLAFGTDFTEGTFVQLTCFLHQKELVMLELNAQVDKEECSVLFRRSIGGDAFSADLTVSGKKLSMSTRKTGEQRSDVFRLDDAEFAYAWNKGTGDLAVQLSQKPPVAMKLEAVENGFRVESTELDKLVKTRLLTGYHCTATVTKGTAVPQPTVKNLNQWSLEDLLIFLNGVWAVINP